MDNFSNSLSETEYYGVAVRTDGKRSEPKYLFIPVNSCHNYTQQNQIVKKI